MIRIASLCTGLAPQPGGEKVDLSGSAAEMWADAPTPAVKLLVSGCVIKNKKVGGLQTLCRIQAGCKPYVEIVSLDFARHLVYERMILHLLKTF